VEVHEAETGSLPDEETGLVGESPAGSPAEVA